MLVTDVEGLVANAIQDRIRVRLSYRRKSDGAVSVHEVAPIDIQPGDTSRTADTEYLWAWCFAEAKLERHLLDRIVWIEPLETHFDAAWILSQWPVGWPRPAKWRLPRDW